MDIKWIVKRLVKDVWRRAWPSGRALDLYSGGPGFESSCHWMDLSSVAPNSTPPRCVNSQLVSLPPVGILTLLCLICIIFVCYAHLNIFTWNLRDINVYYCYYY